MLDRDVDLLPIDLWAQLRCCPLARMDAQLQLLDPFRQRRPLKVRRRLAISQGDDVISQRVGAIFDGSAVGRLQLGVFAQLNLRPGCRIASSFKLLSDYRCLR